MEHGDSLNEGKKKMGWKVYWLMCEKFLEGDDDKYNFAHSFLACKWNLMSHAENVEDCHADNIIWIEDALGFHFPKTKTDQLGKRSDCIWHVYATPESPTTCAHLALSRYLFGNPGILSCPSSDPYVTDATPPNVPGLGMASGITINGVNKLFPGMNQYDRFMKCCHKVSELSKMKMKNDYLTAFVF